MVEAAAAVGAGAEGRVAERLLRAMFERMRRGRRRPEWLYGR